MQVMFATVWATQGQVVLAIAAPEAPHTMALAARRIQDQAVLAMLAPVVRSLVVPVVRNFLDQGAIVIMVPEAPHTMALAARRIQDQAVLAMLALVGPAIQVRVERVKTVRRFADKSSGKSRDCSRPIARGGCERE